MRKPIVCITHMRICEYNIVSPHWEATWNSFIIYFNNIMDYYCFKKKAIMAHKISVICKTQNMYWSVLIGIPLCHIMEKLRTK